MPAHETRIHALCAKDLDRAHSMEQRKNGTTVPGEKSERKERFPFPQPCNEKNVIFM